jgi:hypothetical protein
MVVYNEVQRQFSMPGETEDIVEQYLAYTSLDERSRIRLEAFAEMLATTAES